jgi:hypothetical protein
MVTAGFPSRNENSNPESAVRYFPKRKLTLALSLVLSSVVLAAPLPPRPLTPEHAAQRAILQLATKLDTAAVPGLAQKIVKEHDSENISSVFKMKRRGGLGTGILPENQDGIERLVMAWSRRGPSKDDLNKYEAEVIRTADVIRAMSELAPHRMAARSQRTPEQAKQLQQVADEFKGAALEFRSAAGAKDPARVKSAVTRLSHTCCECHSLID